MQTLLSTVAALFGICAGAWGQAPQPKPPPRLPPPEPLPNDVVKAWVEAGATAGWTRLGDYPPAFRDDGGGGLPRDIPAFRMPKASAAALAKVPAPDRPFGLFLGPSPLADADLKTLAAFPTLRLLQISSANVTDTGLTHLIGLEQLECLELLKVKVGDAGAKTIAGFGKLKSLRLGNSARLTDAGLKELGGLSERHDLAIHTGGTAAELKHLSGLRKLWCLDLGTAKVTDDALAELAALRHLNFLSLKSAALTDAGLKHLAGFTQLRELLLGGQRQTD